MKRGTKGQIYGFNLQWLIYTKYPRGFAKYLVEHTSLKFINIADMFSATYSVVKIKDYSVLVDKNNQSESRK